MTHTPSPSSQVFKFCFKAWVFVFRALRVPILKNLGYFRKTPVNVVSESEFRHRKPTIHH